MLVSEAGKKIYGCALPPASSSDEVETTVYQVFIPQNLKIMPEHYWFQLSMDLTVLICMHSIFEPCCEKTGLRGFRSGPTQTGLYSHRR